MCGICGLISRNSTNDTSLVKSMLFCMNRRGPDGTGLLINKDIHNYESLNEIPNNYLSDKPILGHVRLAIVGDKIGSQPYQSCDKRLVLEHNGEIYNYKEIKEGLIGKHKFVSNTDSEVIVHLLEEYNKKNKYNNFIDAIKKTINVLDGIYALAIKDQYTDTIYLVRDKLGVRQIYYGKNDKIIAFASERKALWKVGIREPITSLLPGHCIIISNSLSQPIKLSDPPIYNKKKPMYNTLNNAIGAYKKSLYESVKKRTQDLERVGIIFSGGIDSVIVTKIVKEFVDDVTCYTSGLVGSNDIEFAKSITKELDIELKVKELNTKRIEEKLPEIINTIETNNITQVEVAIPIFEALEIAEDDGIRVVFTGQGADELFGGYPWYSKIAGQNGYQKLKDYMIKDLLLLYRETLEREDKISMAHSIEMREPFLDPDVVKIATSINMKLNIINDKDIFGKRVHRELARRIGIPYHIAYRKKQSAQHGAGIHGVLRDLAKKNGFTNKMVNKEYINDIKNREKLGSSERYGYMFDKVNSWNSEPFVQLYLDNIFTLNRMVNIIQLNQR